MKKIWTIVWVGFLLSPALAQDNGEDAKAKKILDELSTETKTFATTTIDFKLVVKGPDVNISQTGNAKIKGNSFFYATDDRKVFSDGSTVYTYLIEENECYIDNAEDLEGGINPSELLNIWEDNFKYQYVKEISSGLHEIKLFPKSSKSNYHTVILTVNSTKKRVNKIIVKTKDNVLIQFSLNTLVPNLDLPNATFIWDKNQFKGVEEIDNR